MSRRLAGRRSRPAVGPASPLSGAPETTAMKRSLSAPPAALVVGCAAPVSTQAQQPEATSGPDSPPPPDLGTRKAGVDWPAFLGPAADSSSPEKGLLSPRPKEGPRVAWQRKVGEGYAMPAVS